MYVSVYVYIYIYVYLCVDMSIFIYMYSDLFRGIVKSEPIDGSSCKNLCVRVCV